MVRWWGFRRGGVPFFETFSPPVFFASEWRKPSTLYLDLACAAPAPRHARLCCLLRLRSTFTYGRLRHFGVLVPDRLTFFANECRPSQLEDVLCTPYVVGETEGWIMQADLSSLWLDDNPASDQCFRAAKGRWHSIVSGQISARPRTQAFERCCISSLLLLTSQRATYLRISSFRASREQRLYKNRKTPQSLNSLPSAQSHPC
ncbi:hypothetical protein BU16DRAFT_161956 [Lophium mytilinum]|uniref:Uncharacterized protein n=1 Tax=Lophium mytilinum TaxID=390894 RepID=A0A6A6QDV4_9PEZI|nr:hypothetical protein BU16DRAFT_161956 [Lophium mytilinum]